MTNETRKPIRRGQRVRILPKWQDKGDDQILYIATDNEEKGRVTIAAQLDMFVNPTQVVQASMVEFVPWTDAEIAAEFCRLMRHHLNAGEFVEMLARNAAETDPSICHSHDFCDPNQVMLDALENLGIEWDVDFDTDTPWNIARASGFSLKPVWEK